MIETYLAALWNSTRASIKAGKRLLALMLAATVLITAFPAFNLTANAESDTPEVWNGAIADNFGGGEGTAESPFLISTGGQLAYLAQQVNGGERYSGEYFKLTSDIVLNDVKSASDWDEDTTGLNSWTPIGTSDPTSKPFSGTFDGGGHTVSGIYISSGDDYQGLFGYLGSDGIIKNVGVTDSYVKGKRYVGGVAGSNNGTIQTCYNTGSVTGEGDSVGGIAGIAGKIQACYNTGNIKGGGQVGGIAGTNYGTIQACYSTGSVTGSTSVGGIVGENHISIQKCYYDSTTSDISLGVGNTSEDFTGIAEGKTTDEMQSDTAFEGWDEEVWLFESGKYPQLKAFIPLVKWQDESTGTDTGWYEDSKDSFALTTAAELAGLAKLVNDGNDFSGKTVTLGNDVVLNDTTNASDWDEDTTGLNPWTPIGTSDPTSKPFSGTFDGNDHTVSGIYISSDNDYQGLFGDLGSGGTIKNVGVTDSYIRGNQYVGGVTGFNNSNSGTIQTCYNTGSVSGTEVAAGGVAGINSGTIQTCYNTGSVTGSQHVGGVAGFNASGTIQTCYNTGSVTGTGGNVGGVAGDNEGTIQTCYNTGSVTGESGPVGGVAGNNGGTIQTCCYDSTTSDISLGIGNTSEDATGIAEGKATDDMQTGTAFEGWDEDVWLFEAGKYPQLKAFIPLVKWQDESTGTDTGWYDDHSDESEFTLTTAAELAGLAKLVNDGNDFSGKTVTLGNDIVLNDVENASDWDEDKTGLNLWTPIGTYDGLHTKEISFSGTFDGNDHTVSGIYISSDDNYQGLFGYLGSDSTIENLGITDSYIRGNMDVGGVAGYNNGTIQTCYNTGSVTGEYGDVGGVAGHNNGTIQTCYNTGSVTGTGDTVGGVAGSNSDTIKTCYNTGGVNGESDYVGGVAGYNYSTIQTCYNAGSVTGESDDVGGVAGNNSGTIQTCYNTGSVNGNTYVGGVTGFNNSNSGTIQTCYNTGGVNGSNEVGGVAGRNTGTIKTCYNTGSVTGESDPVGGIAGADFGTIQTCYYDSDKCSVGGIGGEDISGQAEGKTTVEMQSGTAFEGWDEDVWLFESGKYPQLIPSVKWQDGSTGTDTGWYDDHSDESEFTITTAAELAGLAKLVNDGNDFSGKTVTLGKNIILNDVKSALDWDEDTTGLNSWTPIGTFNYRFQGTFDGDGHTVSGIYISSDDIYQGLFGYLGSDGTIKNVGVTDSYVKGASDVGGVAGWNNGTIQTCYNTGSMNGSNTVGGVAGWNNGTIQTCYNTGSMNGSDTVGGVAGYNKGTIQTCYNTGSVTGRTVGGVVGYNFNGTIETCYNAGSVTGDRDVGGVAGVNINGPIQSCYNTGSVSGSAAVGGVAGESSDETLSNNYYSGYVGGVGQDGTAAAADVENGTIPFVSCEYTLDADGTTTISELALKDMNEDFKDAFGITGIQYPEKYKSSDTDVVTFHENEGEKILTGVASGSATVSGKDEAGITITQKELTSEGFKGEESTVTGAINLPVTVKGKPQITVFSIQIGDDTYDGTINEDKHTIAVTVPYGTNVEGLIAEFETTPDTTVTVEKNIQKSGETENDFTDPLTYTVKTEDNTQDYKVTVTVAGETSFQSYSLTDEDGNTYDGTINEDKRTIAVTVPKGTNVKKLTAEFTTSSSVTVEVKGTEQVSGETVNNFTKPVTYKLTAKNGSSQKYKVTVTIHSDNKDDDDKESSHHHSHSSGSAQKPKEPGTKTTVDSGKNSASVSTVANGVRQNGNTAEIHVSVPTITIDSLDSERTLNLSKDASVTVELPKSDIIQQISAGRSANVSLTLPSDAKSDGSSNLAVSINVAKEILEAAKTSGQDMTLAVRYANAQQTAYTWTFQGADLAKSSAPMADVDMRLKVSQTANVPQVNSVTQKNQGVVVQFSQNGALPAPATVTFSAQDQGLNANQSMDLYRYDFSSRQLIPTGKKVAVDAFGNAALTIDRGTDYVLLPDSVKTISLDTCDYTMAAGNSYVTGVTLLNAPAGSYMKTYSSTDGVAATSVLPNGNVKAVGLKPGVTYVMMDLYDKDDKLLTHASVRIVIKEGTTKPSGNSRRQFGIY